MASKIETLIAQVFAYPTLTAISGLTTALSRRETATHAAPPRVVAIPLGAPEIATPDRIGDAGYPDQGRILLVRRFAVDWECHAAPTNGDDEDFTAVEQLYEATLISCRQCFHNSIEFSDEEWVDQQENADGYERFGSIIRFKSVINVPVYEPRTFAPLTTVTSIQTKVRMPTDGSWIEETINE